MLAYQQKESTARVASIMENTNLSKQQQVSEIMRQMLTQAQTAGQYFTNDQIKEMTRKVSAEVDLVHQQTQNQRYGSSPVGVFFSSRRRHTRLVSDWSSDVCSSDLEGPERAGGDPRRCVGVRLSRRDRARHRRTGGDHHPPARVLHVLAHAGAERVPGFGDRKSVGCDRQRNESARRWLHTHLLNTRN